MTPGKKIINNPGVPPSYLTWSDEAKRAYLEELIPEDGTFRDGRFEWSRNHALYASKDKEGYDIDTMIGQPEIELIREKGRTFQGLIPKTVLRISQIKELQDDEVSSVAEAATNLLKATNVSVNRLIMDETRLAESLGIGVSVGPRLISYYPRTDRVSVSWIAVTASHHDAEQWARECPPNDVRKRHIVEEWLRRRKGRTV